MQFTTSFVPEIRFGENLYRNDRCRSQIVRRRKTAAIVIDGFLAQSGLADTSRPS